MFEGGEESARCLTTPLLSNSPSCWLSLEGGLLYAFVGPAAVIVLVRVPSVSWQGVVPRRGHLLFPALQLPPGAFPARRAAGDLVSLTLLPWAPR